VGRVAYRDGRIRQNHGLEADDARVDRGQDRCLLCLHAVLAPLLDEDDPLNDPTVQPVEDDEIDRGSGSRQSPGPKRSSISGMNDARC